MQDTLTIAAIQPNILWEAVEENLQNYGKFFTALSKTVELVVLPEMFSTGFTMNPNLFAESMQGQSVTWMKEKSKEFNVALLGSLVIIENNKFYNRAVFVNPNGEIITYNKRHLFSLAKENEVYTQGNSYGLIHYKGWKINPFICYDLRFPVWSRNTNHYDVSIYMANWPKPRIQAWDSLLRARAIENMCYCIGVNRVGSDENNYEFNGHTQAFDFLGNQIGCTEENQQDVMEVTLHKQEMLAARKKLQFLNDRDEFSIL